MFKLKPRQVFEADRLNNLALSVRNISCSKKSLALWVKA